jgi:hypothetical protein
MFVQSMDRNNVMSNPLLLIAPAINVLVTGLFAGMVLRQYMRRQRSYQLYWSIALCMAFLATLAYVLMLVVQPTSVVGVQFFRVYYILGAELMPSWLGLGSIALVASERVTRVCAIILSVLSVVAAMLILIATIDMQNLRQIAGTPGTGILQPGPWLITTITLNTLGVIAIAGVAIYSGWKLLLRQASVAGFRPVNLLWANVLILAGALLIAAAGTLARFFSVESTFWLVMAVGWIVFFVGVLLTSRRPRIILPPKPEAVEEQLTSS